MGIQSEVLHQPAPRKEYGPPIISIGQTELKAVQQFCYLGCVISTDTKINKEVDNRLAKANSALGTLQTSTEQQKPKQYYKGQSLSSGCADHSTVRP